jgi:hypothetical protein
MNTFHAIFLLAATAGVLAAQDPCPALTGDTMSVPGKRIVLEGEYIETTLRNLSEVRFFRTRDKKLYLRLIVTENFYFGKVDVLEIRSDTKSYYAKNTTQHKVSKTKGLYIVEIFPNYLTTLKDHGITGLAFGQAKSRFTRRDARQVKVIAGCMHQSLQTTR